MAERGSKPASYLLELTGMRALSSLIIALYHFRSDYWILGGNAVGRWFTSWAGFAMPVFFALSGLSVSLMFGADGAHIEKKRFWWGRFTRIYPLYLFVVVIFAPTAIKRVLELAPPGQGALQVFEHTALVVTLLHSFGGPEHVYLWNVPGWTLSVDMVLYAAFPWLAPVLWNRVRDAKSALIVSAVLFAILLSLPVAWEVFEPDGPNPVSDGRIQAFWLSYLKCSVFAWWPAFALGLVLGKVYVMGLGRRFATPLIIGGLLLSSTILWFRPFPQMVMHVGGLMPAAMMVVLGVAYSPPWTRFLSARPLLILGQASFAFYLNHFEGYLKLVRLRQILGLDGRIPKAVFGMGALVILWIAAIALHRLVEKNARQWLRTKPAEA